MKQNINRKISKRKRTTLQKIQQDFFRTQLILILTLAAFLGGSGILINIHFENQKRDQNLQNVAETIARSPILTESTIGMEEENFSVVLQQYLDSLKDTLDDIDVISVVDNRKIRLYHSNHDLIGTVYDGTLPEFEMGSQYYAAYDSGPSGAQRRAYAAIYDAEHNYAGFVMAIALMENIREETTNTLLLYCVITLAAILIEIFISAKLSGAIKASLLGYEPDVFSAMYQIRDNILESLEEGIVARDSEGKVQFANQAAISMLDGKANILKDQVPIKEDDAVVGTVEILHDRAEYTKLMEDLAGTRYLVDSMRANNHDFTNKLHVILGLIQMEMYDEAISYIENITMVQKTTISGIMKAVNEPAVAALLIGKTARASELNVKFILREGSCYSHADLPLPSEVLITIIGNLIDNAFDAMNEKEDDFDTPKELLFGIFSRPGAVLITSVDTGVGIAAEDLDHIFENGYSTKGTGRGTGLYQVKKLVDSLGGTITVESQEHIGTSFSISFTADKDREN